MKIDEAKRLLLRAMQTDDCAMILQIYARMEHVPGWDRALGRSLAVWRAIALMHSRHWQRHLDEYQTLKEQFMELNEVLAKHSDQIAQLQEQFAQLQEQFVRDREKLEEQFAQLRESFQGFEADHEVPAPWLDVDDAPAFDGGYEAGYEAGYAAGYDAAYAQRLETVVRLICHPLDN